VPLDLGDHRADVVDREAHVERRAGDRRCTLTATRYR
jgi:hypothetical protein